MNISLKERSSTVRLKSFWGQLLLSVMIIWLPAGRVAATHVDDTYKYQVMMSGQNTIRIQAPVYDQNGADCWVTDGNLKVTWTDDDNVEHTKETVFHWSRNGDTADSSRDIWIHFSTNVGGSLDITQGNSSNHFTLTKANGDQQRLVYSNSDGRTYNVYAVWRLPYNMLGKTLTFTWDVERDGNGRSKEKVSGLDPVTIQIPAAQDVMTPQVTMATIALSEVGKLELPWFISSTKIEKAEYKYTDLNGYAITETLPAYSNSGSIYLDATVPHDNFRVVVSYMDNNDYLIENVASEAQNLKMIHIPVGLTATALGDHLGSVRLDWAINHPNTDDMMATDFFEVQRSLTGEEDDFVTIGSVPFILDPDNQSFTYTDSTIVGAVTREQLKGGGTLDRLTYRVRRMITQNWGWTDNPTVSSVGCVVESLHLLRIAGYSARWEDERAYTVRVAWDYADESNAVWDDRAQLLLRVRMTNRDGEPVDSMEYALNKNERADRYKVLTLSRPCVNYDIKMVVERGTSPLATWDEVEPYFFPIYNEADWDTFRQKVIDAKGNYDVNARLFADITTGRSCGDSDYPFRGHFDGNGHTMTVTIGGSGTYQALFKYARDYTIENLHVAGSVSGGNHSAGLVGNSSGQGNVIHGCRVSARISCSGLYAGGIVGHTFSTSHDIRNCLFVGRAVFYASGTYFGAIIGWGDDNSGNRITNCLENGEYQNVSHAALCYVWTTGGGVAYADAKSNNWNIHGWDITDRIVINSAADWTSFVTAVANAKGQSEVNAVMNTDISVTTTVGTDDAPFVGTFDGNGHTINVDLSNSSDNYFGLFHTVGNVTIKNLRVTGSVQGNQYTGGLIGNALITGNPVINIEKVWCSANVTSIQRDASGLVGHAVNAHVYMSDCRSDGLITCQGYASALLRGDVCQLYFHRVYENCTFSVNKFSSVQMVHWWNNSMNTWGYNDRSTLCLSAHDWHALREDAKNMNNQNTVVERMNGEQAGSWQLAGGKAVPVMQTGGIRIMDADQLLATFGNGWKKDGDSVVPVTTTRAATSTQTYPTPTLPTFYHESIGKVDKELMTETRQSSVLLTWTTDGNPVDFFQVMRRVKGTETWDIIATDLDQMVYEDNTVSPLLDYEYKVRATSDCEGISYTETDVAQGACKHTGRLEGYVRFNDGTGVADITVEIAPADEADRQQLGTTVTVTTDDSGFFMAEDLPYLGRQSITYQVTPVSTGGIKLENTQYAVTFDNRSNLKLVHEFTITNGMQFSTYVMYEGTSIPVKGAHFLVNGNEVHNNRGGFVETDFEGKASFFVLGNVKTVIQVVMDGHTFANDGFYKSSEGVVLTDNVAQTYFYDTTRVKLIGRVVGGKDQGDLPLDNNLSRNNLGDNLTMVLTLEGDNTSWLVYDNLNPAVAKRHDVFTHTGAGHQTTADVERKRMVVHPDLQTGEFMLMLPPVRWKVQQLYCEGYPTLFQEGMVSEVIDLTSSLKMDTVVHEGTYTDIDKRQVYHPTEVYHAKYNRIYHAPVEISYRQIGYDTFDYFGDKSYVATTVGGDKFNVPLAYEATVQADDHGPEFAPTGQVIYTFGYPVFSIERKYPIEIQVGERYYYNNDRSAGQADMVTVGNGLVTIHNGMKNGVHQQTVQLNSDGYGTFLLDADQTTKLLTGEDALHTVTMTLTQDGTTYEAEPLRGYIFNMFATGEAKDVLTSGMPMLLDVLRDPPGGGSSATLSKGSRQRFTYTIDMAFHSGLKLSWTTGTTLENFQGVVAAPEGVGSANGIINSSDIETPIEFEYAFDMEGERAFSYTMDVSQDISTSSEPSMVGADADLYIGIVQNIQVTPVSTIRAIPDSLYQQMLGRLGGRQTAGIEGKYGTLTHIAEGIGPDQKKYHLVRDESIGYGPQVKSNFIHSQKHILTQLIPEKVKELRALMFTGTAAEAQAQADATGKPVYRSLVSADDENFGLVNTKGDEVFYYTSTMPEEQGMNYVIHLPNGVTEQPTDEVAELCQVIYAWVQMIAENENEKLRATDLVGNYDVDGGSRLSYGEAFESEYTLTNYYHLPGFISGSYFEESGADIGLAASAILGVKVVSKIVSMLWDKLSTTSTASRANKGDNKNPAFETRMAFYGKTFKFSILPTMDYTTKDKYGETKAYSRKESFTIELAKTGHLNIDVLRAMTDTAYVATGNVLDVFTNYNFEEMTKYAEGYLTRNIDKSNFNYPRGFVYRTRGGATTSPWEDARYTLFYEKGKLLDERTKKISNPKITLDRQSVSGVPMGEPARFKVYLTNESEMPEAATGSLASFTFYLDEESNPNGAKVYVDGTPLNGNGMSVYLYPGKVMEKTVEIYAGDGFDYEGIRLGLASQDIEELVTLDVHYLHEAGPVNIASPGDKWIMNTDAQFDDNRGWYLPVTINGFDKHQHNFDHIEFQYKESQRGDNYWTNICSYYADSTLMAQASGVREMIPENGNIVTYFYGDGTVMEKAYDLRAMLYCRNGNSFLTTASKIISGVKDTRRPQIFGTPEPISGILGVGDNIVFNFSEDIEYNYLNAVTNFEVKGEVNNTNVTETVSLQFAGQASVESEAQRNFSGKDVTIDLMVKPSETGRDMPLFSHGTNGKQLQLWLTADFKLRAVIDEQRFTSTEPIDKGLFTQVTLAIKAPDVTGGQSGQLTFYNGGKQIGTFEMTEAYNGTGPLIFGRTNETDRNLSQYYEGRMMEARIWYRALTGGQVGTTYGSKRLTGYEMGLVDYYPMNEGSGDYAIDHTQGANAQLMGASWAMPRGLSLSLDTDDHGVELTQNAMNRTSEQDYTLMFWFKTAAADATLVSNGRGRKEDIGSANQFFIGMEAKNLTYRSNGQAYSLGDSFGDNQWHHYAITVDRAHGLANIYVDQTLRATFAADSLGGINGGHPFIGATRYDELDADGRVTTIDAETWLQGNVDELCFFAQALPLTLIKSYATKSPSGDEAGLLTYLSFDRQERQQNNDIELVAYPYSKKLYLDNDGNVRYELDPLTQQPTTTPMRDYVFVGSPNEVLKHITNETAAPVVPYEELKNLKFSFAGQGNKLLVNIDEQAARLNRRNLYVTVRDVEDKNGNAMASPVTACYYVSNSSLQWAKNRLTTTMPYGEDSQLALIINNTGNTSHTFTIENCPKWLTFDNYSDVIAPQDALTVRGTVNKNLNVGSYDEIIYLTDEDGITEPLYINLTIEGATPDWAWNVPGDLLQNSMNIAGQVYLNGQIDIDSRDIVGVFDRENQCHGFANISYSSLTGESGLYLTVYDNQPSGRELFFKIWQYATGQELVLTANGGETITFQRSAVIGTDTPVRFEGGSSYVQVFDLKKGWNWVSFNVASESLFDLNTLLDGLPWQDNDVLTDLNSDVTLIYAGGHWLGSGDVESMRLQPQNAYAIMVQDDVKFPIAGNVIKQEDMRTIELSPGWNGIGYTPMMNLTVETALSDYYDKAEPGDVIKSHNEFAYFTVTGGVGRWRGSLEYMKPGQGYMLLRKSQTPTSFLYPYYEPTGTFVDDWSFSGAARAAAPALRSTMCVTAVVEGVELQEGDRLVAFADGEMVGSTLVSIASADASETAEPLYLTIGGDDRKPVWFAVEREGELIAATQEVMTFKANDVVGSPDDPTTISFTDSEGENGRWFTTSGIQLPARPVKSGIYIYNGKKVAIK